MSVVCDPAFAAIALREVQFAALAEADDAEAFVRGNAADMERLFDRLNIRVQRSDEGGAVVFALVDAWSRYYVLEHPARSGRWFVGQWRDDVYVPGGLKGLWLQDWPGFLSNLEPALDWSKEVTT